LLVTNQFAGALGHSCHSQTVVPRPLDPVSTSPPWDSTSLSTDQVTPGQDPILCLGKEDGKNDSPCWFVQ